MARGLDLGIAGRKAIVCGSSKGLGRACAAALADAGVEIVVNGRDRERLEHTAAEIAQASGHKVHAVVADVRQAAGRETLLAACPEPDILINNAGGPPPGDFREWTEERWTEAVSTNMLAPIMLIKATIDAMTRKKWGRVVNITSSAVKAPLPTLGLSNGARSGLTGFIAGLAREVAGDGVTINNLLRARSRPTGCKASWKRLRSGKACPSRRCGGNGNNRSRQSVWDSRTSSARRARFCAASTPAISPGRISCLTAALIPACSEPRHSPSSA